MQAGARHDQAMSAGRVNLIVVTNDANDSQSRIRGLRCVGEWRVSGAEFETRVDSRQ